MNNAGSLAELILQQWLTTHGIPFIAQFIVHKAPGFMNRFRRGDLFLPHLRTVLLPDGEPWHRNPEERAAEEMFYRANGIWVIRFPEEELREAAEKGDVRQFIEKWIPALLYGISAPPQSISPLPMFTPFYGRGRIQQIERRIRS